MTNYETLYTFVIDTTKVKSLEELAAAFMTKYAAVFRGRFGYTGAISEEILVHKAVDRSVIAVMNSFFLMTECRDSIADVDEVEAWLNEIPVIARDLIPSFALRDRLK